MTAQSAMVMMSSSWCRLQRSILGSSKAPRHSPIEVFLPSLIAPPIHLHNPGFLFLAKSATYTRLPCIVLSFASEQHDYVARVAEELDYRGVRVFYDAFFYDAYGQANLWGRNLVEYF